MCRSLFTPSRGQVVGRAPRRAALLLACAVVSACGAERADGPDAARVAVPSPNDAEVVVPPPGAPDATITPPDAVDAASTPRDAADAVDAAVIPSDDAEVVVTPPDAAVGLAPDAALVRPPDAGPPCVPLAFRSPDEGATAVADPARGVHVAVDAAVPGATLVLTTAGGDVVARLDLGSGAVETPPLAPGHYLAVLSGRACAATARQFWVAAPVDPETLALSDLPVDAELPEVDRVVAHHMGWFGGSDHIDVGYDSTDPLLAARQVALARRLGIHGFVTDWYGGLSEHIDRAFQAIAAAALQTPDFAVGLMYDYGALRWGAPDPHDAASVTATMIADLTDAHARYMAPDSPYASVYLTQDARPLILMFPYDDVAHPDLAAVRAVLEGLQPPPVLVDLNPDPEAAPHVGGFASWINFEGGTGAPYLRWFYQTMVHVYPEHMTVGVAWPGFDDTLAAWGGGRIQDRRCGLQLAETLQIARDEAANTGRRWPILQLATWNDYEEGSTLETGVEACLSFTEHAVERTPEGDRVRVRIDDPAGRLRRWEVWRAGPAGLVRLDVRGPQDTESVLPVLDRDAPADYRVRAVPGPLMRAPMAAVEPTAVEP